MYELAKKARSGMKSKAERLAGEKDRKTDSSDWSPAPELNADVKTGMRPVSRRAYKKGGKVVGCATPTRADRKPRKAGGKIEAKGEQPLVDRYINRDLKKANEYRDGKKHVGALKHGGRAHKNEGGGAGDGKKTLRPKNVYEPDYNPESVNKAIASSKQKIGASEAKKIHSLLGGWRERVKRDGRKDGGRTKLQQGGKPPVNWEQAEENYRPTKRDPNYKPADLSEGSEQITKMINAQRSRQEAQRKHGGRAKKADGGPLMGDARLGLVKPKAMEFNENVVTPGLKKGGRIAKAAGGSFWGSKEFQSAFRDARKAYLAGEGPKTFEFKGKTYGTDLLKIPTPPERQRPVQEKKITVEFGKSPMPKTDQLGNPNPGMKKGGRIAKQIGGALGRAANALGRGMAPAAMGSAMRPQLPPMPIGSNPATMGRGPAPQAVANAQGQPFQPGGKFAPQPMAYPQQNFASPGSALGPAIGPISGSQYLSGLSGPMVSGTSQLMPSIAYAPGGGQIIDPATGQVTAQLQSYTPSPTSGGMFANGGRVARAYGGETGHKSKGKSKSKSGKTHINIVIATGKDQQQQMPPAPMGGPMPPPPPPPLPASPVGGPMAGPMGAPPMPPPAMGGGMPPLLPDMMGGAPMPRKAGGRVTKVAKSYKDMTAGAGSGEGRLQKTDIAKRAPHKAGGKVYRSYKDMDAGAGSGKGRIEKTEIQKRKK